MHVDDFYKAFNILKETFPHAVEDTDNNGQIIIYTGLMSVGDSDEVVPFEEHECTHCSEPTTRSITTDAGTVYECEDCA